MVKVLEELDAGARAEAAEWFGRINLVMRRANDPTLAELAKNSEGKRLWKGTFAMLPKGKALNKEWHLEIDMASVRNAGVPPGKVVHAGRLGIGDCVKNASGGAMLCER